VYDRKAKLIAGKSSFLLGPRGTGKSTWVKLNHPQSDYIDLLHNQTFNTLLADPDRLETYINNPEKPIIIDEVQKVPALLNTVHRLIENNSYKFILTGSSARKLRREGVNLLAGRAYTKNFHPLTVVELGEDFSLEFSLQNGFLPSVFSDPSPKDYLSSYVTTYLREEVQQEGLVRNLANFSRFLEAASFSQASVVNISNVAADCSINRRVASEYFNLLEDLLIGYRLPVFQRKAKRKLLSQPKFYFFDCGVYRAIRPTGPLDEVSEIEGLALESMVFQQLRAINDNNELGYQLYFWRTKEKVEVDFVLYGENGFIALEVKRSDSYRRTDLKGLKLFKKDYPQARCILLYLGKEKRSEDGIEVLPLEDFFREILKYL